MTTTAIVGTLADVTFGKGAFWRNTDRVGLPGNGVCSLCEGLLTSKPPHMSTKLQMSGVRAFWGEPAPNAKSRGRNNGWQF
jgi:hypothetical protein